MDDTVPASPTSKIDETLLKRKRLAVTVLLEDFPIPAGDVLEAELYAYRDNLDHLELILSDAYRLSSDTGDPE